MKESRYENQSAGALNRDDRKEGEIIKIIKEHGGREGEVRGGADVRGWQGRPRSPPQFRKEGSSSIIAPEWHRIAGGGVSGHTAVSVGKTAAYQAPKSNSSVSFVVTQLQLWSERASEKERLSNSGVPSVGRRQAGSKADQASRNSLCQFVLLSCCARQSGSIYSSFPAGGGASERADWLIDRSIDRSIFSSVDRWVGTLVGWLMD